MATMTLDNLISESGRRSGIGGAAEPLTRELLRLMTGGPGGLGAFLDRLRSAPGLGAEVSSVLGGRSEAELPAQAVDSLLGSSTVANVARRVGVEPAAASAAMGFEIPKLIGLLAPGGKVPAALPSEIQTFIGREQVSPVGMATIRNEEQVRPVAMQAVPRAGPNLNWLWGLLALALLGALLWALLPRRPVVPVAQVAPPAVAPPVIPTPAPVAQAVTTLNQDLGRDVLRFATGSAVLPAESLPMLQQAADRLKTLPAGSAIEIAGHTDNTGNAAANMDLSQRRADAVRNALIQDGVAPTTLVAKGYGETRPVASNDTPDGRLQNRRTEFNVVSTTTTTTTTTTTNP